MTKVAAILLVASLWIAEAVVRIGALNTHLHRPAASKAVAGAPPLSAADPPPGRLARRGRGGMGLARRGRHSGQQCRDQPT